MIAKLRILGPYLWWIKDGSKVESQSYHQRPKTADFIPTKYRGGQDIIFTDQSWTSSCYLKWWINYIKRGRYLRCCSDAKIFLIFTDITQSQNLWILYLMTSTNLIYRHSQILLKHIISNIHWTMTLLPNK